MIANIIPIDYNIKKIKHKFESPPMKVDIFDFDFKMLNDEFDSGTT